MGAWRRGFCRRRDLEQERAGPCSQHRGAALTGNPAVGGTVTGTVQSGIQGSVRARAGYAFGRLLPYVTGGVAFGSFYTDAPIVRHRPRRRDQLRRQRHQFRDAGRLDRSAPASNTRSTTTGRCASRIPLHSDFGPLAISTGPLGGRRGLRRRPSSGLRIRCRSASATSSARRSRARCDAPNIVKGPALAANDLPKPAGGASVRRLPLP